MATRTIHACPSCESNEWVKTAHEPVPGGTDWRHYECADCGFEWRV